MLRIYTDGSCEGNPGKGGWAALIVGDAVPQVLSGYEGRTTNNRMEQTAAIKGLEATPPGAQVTVFSDSQYVVRTMTRNWKRRVNQDLWELLDELAASRRVRWEEVRAHSGHPENEYVQRPRAVGVGGSPGEARPGALRGPRRRLRQEASKRHSPPARARATGRASPTSTSRAGPAWWRSVRSPRRHERRWPGAASSCALRL